MPYYYGQTRERVKGVDPLFTSRFLWRAEFRCAKLNEKRKVRYYRYEVEKVGKKYQVVAMQNRARP